MRAMLLACGLLLAPAALQAQSTPAQAEDSTEPTFRTGIDLVRVDVTVTSRGDEPVADLTIDDFEVREDGVVQTIQSAQFVRLTGHPPPGDDLSLDIRSPGHAAQEAAREDVRILVIFVDDYHLRCGAPFDHQLKQVISRFVRAEMRPTDLMAVMGPLTPISDLGFTRSREAVLERINRIQGRLGCFVPPRSVLEENQFSLNAGQRARIRAQISFSALQSLAVHLGGLREGRKSVLFISEGPPVIAERLQLFDHLRDVIAAANTNNVTIHTMDPRALGASYGVSTANESLAAETGGRRLSQSNDHSRALRAVMTDASAYYLLGYAPDRVHSDGKFHRIEVKVRRKRVRVLARHGYWAPRPEEQLPGPVTPVAPPEITEVLTSLSLDERPRLAIDAIGVEPLEHGVSVVTVACTAADDAGAAGAIDGLTAELLKEDDSLEGTFVGEHVKAEGIWVARFQAAPGTHKVRLTVVDAAGETLDTWVRRLQVAGAHDVSAHVGTPVVYRARTAAAYRALRSGADAAPTVGRHFRRADRVLVRLPLSAGLAASDVRAELMNGHGQTLLTLPVARRAGGLPQVELPVSSLAQSAYVLRLTATFNGAAASHLLPFAVVP